MANLQKAFLISAGATCAAVAAWTMGSRWRARTEQLGAGRANVDLRTKRTRADEIEELTQEQKDLMLREFADHV